jgi:hypothetical protein
MSTFDSTKTALGTLLDDIISGKIQLPDFQRGWVWDDEHIQSLLVSIARSFPIGAVMLLETGGETRFQMRAVEGVALADGKKPERLILDGQQRLTSLTQVLKLQAAVATRDEKKREIKRYYYFDIDKALSGPTTLAEAIVAVGEDRVQRTNFGRDIVLDLSSTTKEYDAFCFPCNQVFDANDWMYGLMQHRQDRVQQFMRFSQAVLEPFRRYQVPVIELNKETSKEAVCLVFEKVNTGGVPLSVFELVTATYAADGFNLRRDWFGEGTFKGRGSRWTDRPLIRDTAATDFLQGVSLLCTYELQQRDLKAGKTGKAVTAVSAKREHILSMPLAAYQKWAEPLTLGFLEADQFLRHLGFHHPDFLPYRAQLIPLATALTHLGDRWLEPQVQRKLAQWYWCGVFGELYGSASETRIALDLQHLLSWVNDDSAPLPGTVAEAGFQSTRLDTMRSRTSAAYRGLYVLLQNQGARDFFWKARMVDIDRNDKGIDIHHIFPRKWCDGRKISPRVYNSIVNKTAISYKANRKIGGNAPSEYLRQLQNDRSVQLGDAEMDEILASHSIVPAPLRADNFEEFFRQRKTALLALIEQAMGKQAVTSPEAPADDGVDLEEDELENVITNGEEQSSTPKDDLDDTDPRRHSLRLEFWKMALDALEKTEVKLYENVSPSKDHWLTAGSGLSGVHYNMIFCKHEARVELGLGRGKKEENKAMFDVLFSCKDQIERKFGASLEWRRLDDKKVSIVALSHSFDGYEKANWPRMLEWLVENLRRMEKAFTSEIPALREILRTQFPKEHG